MIHIFFVPGMFGSTVEHVLTSYTNEFVGDDSVILPNGSMHSHRKQKHITTKRNFIKFFVGNRNADIITTPIYPLEDAHLPEMLEIFYEYSDSNDKRILIHADSVASAELNMLFQYHKIGISHKYPCNFDIYCGNSQSNFSQWNSNYTRWKQMQPWELREWLSLFYPDWVTEWIDSQHQVDADFLKVSFTSILNNTEQTLTEIIEHCGLTRNSNDLSAFVAKWQAAQDYIWQEYLLLEKIIYCIIHLVDFSWNKLNIVAEAILQQRLRSLGFEIQCDGLNELPTNSVEIYKLFAI